MATLHMQPSAWEAFHPSWPTNSSSSASSPSNLYPLASLPQPPAYPTSDAFAWNFDPFDLCGTSSSGSNSHHLTSSPASTASTVPSHPSPYLSSPNLWSDAPLPTPPTLPFAPAHHLAAALRSATPLALAPPPPAPVFEFDPPSASSAAAAAAAAASAAGVARPDVTTDKVRLASARRRVAGARFVCPLPDCSSTFTKKHNMQSHLRAHNDDRPFACRWCDRRFGRTNDCSRHERKHCKHRPAAAATADSP